MADIFDDLDDGDKVGRKEMKEEAMRRMKNLGMSESIISKFKDGKLQMSENGILYDADDKVKMIVAEHEKEFGELIYHVIHSFSNIGETYECLFVSQYLDDWNYENDMLERKIVYAYVENVSAPEYSEAGSIIVTNKNGSLFRIG